MLRTLPILLLLRTCLAGGRGSDFDIHEHQSVRPGVTTLAQVLENFGEPTTRFREDRNGLDSEVLVWQYAETAGDTPEYKKSFMEFVNGRLYGHQAYSTDDKNASNIPDQTRRSIQKGKTTKTELLKLLGRPSGITAYPSNMMNEGKFPEQTRQKMASVIFFTSVTYRQKKDTFFSERVIKEFWVALDRQDVVIDTSYFEATTQ